MHAIPALRGVSNTPGPGTQATPDVLSAEMMPYGMPARVQIPEIGKEAQLDVHWWTADTSLMQGKTSGVPANCEIEWDHRRRVRVPTLLT